LNQWTHGDLITVHMLGLIHNEFASMFQRRGNSFNRSVGDTLEDGMAGYQWVARYTREFLDAYLKHDANAMTFLKKTPADNHVPRHVMIAGYRAAQGPPPTIEGFRVEAGRQGFERAKGLYVAMHKKDPDFRFKEGTALILWAHDLIDHDHLTEAVDLTKVYEEMEPRSGEAYYLSGLAYEKSGKRQLAVEKYRKAVETGNGPTDKAQARLTALENTATSAK
jgi:tetratricopeptide (TPR) repeat protein